MAEQIRQIFYRGVLPFVLLGGAALRPSFLSLAYVSFALIGPAFPPLCKNASIPGFTKLYLLSCVVFSLLASILQLAYQIFEFMTITEIEYFKQCPKNELKFWFRQAGLIRLPSISGDGVGLFDGFRIVAPEIMSLFVSVLTFVVCTTFRSVLQPQHVESINCNTSNSGTATNSNLDHSIHSRHFSFLPSLKRLSDVFLTLFIAFVAAVQPCALNSVYFVLFLVLVTWWALYTPLRRQTFNTIKRFLIVYSGVHILTIYAYQIQFLQDMIPPNSLVARTVGLTALMSSNCNFWWTLHLPTYYQWTNFVNFALLIVVYYVLLAQFGWTKHGVSCSKAHSLIENDNESSVHEELLSNSGNEELSADTVFPLQRITSAVLDRQKISVIFRGPNAKSSITVKGLQSFLYFCVYHCYVFALLTMMTWALLYHSVFGLVFLILSCFLWALRNSRKWTFRISPIILCYTEFLLLAQYVYSMDIKDILPDASYVKIIGFISPEFSTQAIVTFCVKVLLSLPLFVLLRLNLREDFYNSLTEHDRLKRLNYGTFDAPDNSKQHTNSLRRQSNLLNDQNTGAFESISEFFVKYWIFVVAFFLLINGITDPPVLYSIIFFVFFLVIIVNLHISFVFFKKTSYLFLTILIIYSSLVLIAVYSYQFSSVPELFHNFTGLGKNWTDDIGLVQFGNVEHDISLLFIRLILPISLIVVTMLQLKFFHDPWKKIVQMPRTQQGIIRPEQNENAFQITQKKLKDCLEVVWRLIEVHGYRFILFVLVLVAVKHFCALNFLIIVFISIALCFTSFMPLISLLICVYLSTIFIARRIFQLNLMQSLFSSDAVKEGKENFASTFSCDNIDVSNTSTEFRYTLPWIGFEKNDFMPHLQSDSKDFILVIVLVCLQICVCYWQRHHRLFYNIPEPPAGIIFPDVNASAFDSSILNCFKCFLNYGFYKFGLEFSLTAMVIVAWIRMDLLGALLILWALLFVAISRENCQAVWPIFVTYLAIMFPLQYGMAIGLPVEWCIDYPWNHLLDNMKLDENLSLFLDLANNRMNADRFLEYIVADFFLLLITACQRLVFKQESNEHPAGSNSSIYKDNVYILHKNNPRYDFVAEQKNFVDFFKLVVFTYGHWITMITVLAAGLGGTSLFALGYLILAFWMLWQGNNLYTMNNYDKTIKQWTLLVYYTAVVMFFKVALQIFGCSLGYLIEFGDVKSIFSLCTIEKLFSIVCVNSVAINNAKSMSSPGRMECDLEGMNRETKIGFDTIAFIFILFQLRILNSWFFQLCMIEFRCEMIQARRGAVLINQLIEKEMREQQENQNGKFQEIKDRTAAIRKRYEEQQKRGSSTAFIPQTYGQATKLRPLSLIDQDDPLPTYNLHSLTDDSGIPAKRAGDYYMFDYDPDTDELIEPVQSFVPEVTPGAGDFDKLDPAQLLHTAIQRDMDLTKTLSAVKSAERIKDDELRMVAAVAKTQKDRDHALEILNLREKRKLMEASENSQKPVLSDEPSTSKACSKQSIWEEDDSTVVKFRKSSQRPTDESSLAKEYDDEDEKKNAWGDTIISVVRFIIKIILSMLDWAAAFLNRRSREHRYVSYVLNKEKERLKIIMKDELYNARKTASELRRHWESCNIQLVTSEADIRRLEEEAHTRWEDGNVFARLTTAIGNCFSAHTDVFCFFMAIVAHARSAGLITLPLPGLVFFWGSLGSPRPSKLFWVCMIGYTELTIVVKFLFQFSFWPWNKLSDGIKALDNPYEISHVLGIQRIEFFAVADVALLILLFFHRYMLRKLGLWKDANIQETFSVSKSVSSENSDLSTRCGVSNTGTTATTVESLSKSREDSVAVVDETKNPQKEDYESKTSPSNDSLLLAVAAESNKNTKMTSGLSAFNKIKEVDNNVVESSCSSLFMIFVCKLLQPKFRYIRDLYPLMFFLDVFCFFVVAFGYSAFGEGGSGNVINDLQTNRVPLTFVVMLIMISLMIVIDRGLYLRKAVVCKLIYQLVLVVLLHIWIFGVLPQITKTEAFMNSVAKFLYVIKCIYFLISAWQIRNGYPPLCIGNLLTHSYGLLNMVLFKVFLIIPFLFELRTAIDWTWTDTSMPLFDFFNMENFYSLIYNLKCARTFETSFPAPRGEPKGKVVKYFMGLPMILILILVIWCPLLAFSMLNQIGEKSTPDIAKLSVSVEGFPPLYRMEAQGIDLQIVSDEAIAELTERFTKSTFLNDVGVDASRQAVSFVNEYKDGGILKVNFRPESEVIWQISSESLDALRFQLLENTTLNNVRKTMNINLHIEFQRPRLDKTREPTIHSIDFPIPITESIRNELFEALSETKEIRKVTIPFAIPMNLIVPNEGEVKPANVLLRAAFNSQNYSQITGMRESYNNLVLMLSSTNNDSHWVSQLAINENILNRGFCLPLDFVKYGRDRSLHYVELIAFVDRVFPTYISKFVQGGIIAMYIAVVLLVGKIIRGLVTSSPLDVIISEIPNPDYLLKICTDIYLVREARDFVLEQDLFAKLIFLFRSPATLIKWTRYKIKVD